MKDEQKHLEILNSRPGKIIPQYVIEGMKKTYQEPTLEEFDEIHFKEF